MRFCGVNAGKAVRCSFGLLVFIVVPGALSQDPVLKTRTKEEREEQFNLAHRITMDVQVTDAAGNPVSDLRPADFSIYDNHQQRRIVAFHPIDGEALHDATQVTILLDAVNTPPQALEEDRAAIFKYLAQSRKPFEFPTAFALWFNGHLTATPASTDRNEIGRAFVKLTKNLHSNACGGEQNPGGQAIAVSKGSAKVDAATCRAVHFKDSVAALDGVAQQQLSGGGRTLLMWIGTGWPTFSETQLQQLAPKQQHDYASEFDAVLHDLQAAQVTVYSLSAKAGDDTAKVSAANASGSNGESALPRLAADEFARRTGGRVIAGSSDLVADLRSCIRDAEWYYSLSFNAPPAQNGGAELHALEVKVNRPGLEVRAMNSYYAGP